MDADTRFRLILTEVDEDLSDQDRKRLHFVIGNVIPKRLREHPTVADTVILWETLFERGKISSDDFQFLIDTFDGIGCHRAARKLRDFAKQNGKLDTLETPQSINYLTRFEEDGAVCLPGRSADDRAAATHLLIPSTPDEKVEPKRKTFVDRRILYGAIFLLVTIAIASSLVYFFTRPSTPKPPPDENDEEKGDDRFVSLKTNRVIQAYLTAWSTQNSLEIAEIRANKLTHLAYAFAEINVQGEIQIGYPNVDFKNFDKLAKLKEKYPHLRTLISVGGYDKSSPYPYVAATEQNRTKFAESCVRFLRENHFDGIEVNWKNPVTGAQPNPQYRPEDKTNFPLLLKEMRRVLNKSKQKKYLLTIAGSVAEHIANLDLPAITPHVDWIHVLTYHFHGTWESQTGHAAALRANDDERQNDYTAKLNCDAAIQEYIDRGVRDYQLVMGLNIYGAGWQGVKTTDKHGYRQITSKTPPDGTGQKNSGVFTYDDLRKNYLRAYDRFFDPQAQVPFLFNASTGIWISYEDPQSVRLKAEYADVRHLRGISFWDLNANQNSELITLGFDILTNTSYSLPSFPL